MAAADDLDAAVCAAQSGDEDAFRQLFRAPQDRRTGPRQAGRRGSAPRPTGGSASSLSGSSPPARAIRRHLDQPARGRV
jgi:hypothetical protein